MKVSLNHPKEGTSRIARLVSINIYIYRHCDTLVVGGEYQSHTGSTKHLHVWQPLSPSKSHQEEAKRSPQNVSSSNLQHFKFETNQSCNIAKRISSPYLTYQNHQLGCQDSKVQVFLTPRNVANLEGKNASASMLC